MKKAIVLAIVLSLLAATFLHRISQVKSAAGANTRTEVSAPASAQEQLKHLDPVKLNAVAEALAKAEPLSGFERAYINESPKLWKRHLAQSQVAVQSRDLIEKSNRGTLTDKEALTLVNEMRRQHILVTLITRARVEQIKRRYL
jgi:hypothetical protein